MRRTLILALAFVAGVAVRDATAQSAAPPVELGLEASTTVIPDGRGLQWGPRLVVNRNGRDAVQFTASFQKLSRLDDQAQSRTDSYLAAYRRLVRADGPVRIFATLGGGLERTVIVTSAITFGEPPVTFPASRGVEVLPVVTTGGAVEFRFGSRAAIVLESTVFVSGRIGGRFSGGLVVPIGAYPTRPGRLASPAPWAALDAGERAWVTTSDGREVNGEVVRQSAATLTLRTLSGMASFTADDVRAIDTTDPIRNGTVLGAKIGGFGAIAPSVFITYVACAFEEECGVREVLWVNGILVGMGVGIGAAMGALADSLRERRVPLYRRPDSTGVTLAPIVGRHRLGGGVVIRW
jgi:hypothetical protein